jgi:hypothetical protein
MNTSSRISPAGQVPAEHLLDELDARGGQVAGVHPPHVSRTTASPYSLLALVVERLRRHAHSPWVVTMPRNPPASV